MVKIKPIYPYPALLLQTDQKYIIISDLHIGFESNLNARGINISSDTYVDEILNYVDEKEVGSNIINNENQDELYETALEIVKSERKASTSFLQRKLQIGYNRAARIIDMMEANGEVSKANHVGKREVFK